MPLSEVNMATQLITITLDSTVVSAHITQENALAMDAIVAQVQSRLLQMTSQPEEKESEEVLPESAPESTAHNEQKEIELGDTDRHPAAELGGERCPSARVP